MPSWPRAPLPWLCAPGAKPDQGRSCLLPAPKPGCGQDGVFRRSWGRPRTCCSFRHRRAQPPTKGPRPRRPPGSRLAPGRASSTCPAQEATSPRPVQLRQPSLGLPRQVASALGHSEVTSGISLGEDSADRRWVGEGTAGQSRCHVLACVSGSHRGSLNLCPFPNTKPSRARPQTPRRPRPAARRRRVSPPTSSAVTRRSNPVRRR